MNVLVDRRSTAGRVALVLAAFLVVCLVVAALAVAGVAVLAQGLLDGVNVTVDGERWFGGSPGLGQVLAAMGGLLVAGLVLVTVVPMALGLALGAVALAVGLVVLPVLLAVFLALTPLWLLALVLWLALRKPRRPATTMSP
jgi:hypothetical protein